MKTITLNNHSCELITNYKNAYDEQEIQNRFTDYFEPYDYVVGDWAYGKLRLKGFYEDKNPKANKINKYSNLDKYIEENCAFGCKYFVAKKKK